jgi:hypothetical protein
LSKLDNYILQPYYVEENSFSVSNKEKGELGEKAFVEAINDFPIMINITYGKRQKDIDHLVFAANSVVMNECKNTNEGFFMHYSWFCSHIADRFAGGLPIAQYYAQTAGVQQQNNIYINHPQINL